MSSWYPPPPGQPDEPWPPQGSNPPPGQQWPPQGSYPPPGQPWPPQGSYPPPYPAPYAPPPVADPLISADYSGWFHGGLALFRRAWKPLAALQGIGLLLPLIALVPAAIFVAVSWRALVDIFRAEPGARVDSGPLIGLFVVIGLGVIVAGLAQAVVSVANVRVTASVAVGAPVSINDALRFGLSRMFPLIGWELLALPIYLVAFCMCFLPMIYIAAVFTVLTSVIAIERTNAISRCFSLFHRDLKVSASRIGTIFGISILASLAVSMVGLPIQLSFQASVANGQAPNANIIAAYGVYYLITFVVQFFLPILLGPLTLAAYADMRARVEPVSSGQIAQELGITYGGPAVA